MECDTNRTVVHLMTEILKPQSGESIYDPTCGSAGMLISSIAYLQQNKKEWRNVKLYGQEINALSASIGKMNLFLHGIKDFEIINDDTLKSPAFLENNQLRKFDICLANPPYSIKQWDRSAFESDRYGRNFLGTSPQGRADYAFIQHILKSLKDDTGRCAILLPHGILNRQEEKAIREKLIEFDLVDCIIGLGKNLFYNSPMEACILICCNKKTSNKIGKILFIDAREYVTKKNTESFLTEEQIQVIANAYKQYQYKEDLCACITNNTIKENNYSLAINLYVKHNKTVSIQNNISELYNHWKEKSIQLDNSLKTMSELLGENL